MSARQSLNPYCSGRWSRTDNPEPEPEPEDVLILIVVEDGLVRVPTNRLMPKINTVLILIVVEDGLVHRIITFCDVTFQSLNPYCSGRWSRTLLNAVKGSKIKVS